MTDQELIRALRTNGTKADGCHDCYLGYLAYQAADRLTSLIFQSTRPLRGATRKQNLAGGNAPEGVRPKYRGLCIAVPRVVKYKLRTILVDSTGDECFSLRKGNHLANNL